MTETIAGYKVHPVAALFPLLEGEEYAQFKESIRKQGLKVPIEVMGDVIVDGRNRARACADLGIEPRFSHYEGDDPVGHITAMNLARRHMSETQRAMIAGRIASLAHGVRSDSTEASIEASAKQRDAAHQLKVGRASVQRARTVITKAIPEVVDACDAGKLAVSAAATLAELPKEKQREVIQEAGGNMRKVRALVREAGGKAPVYPKSEPPAPIGQPTGATQPKSRELDEKVREAWEGGALSQAEIARQIGCAPNTVHVSLRRQGIIQPTHPVQSIERRARETAEDMLSFMRSPETYRDGADTEKRQESIKSLRALISASRKVINWLNDEAIGG